MKHLKHALALVATLLFATLIFTRPANAEELTGPEGQASAQEEVLGPQAGGPPIEVKLTAPTTVVQGEIFTVTAVITNVSGVDVNGRFTLTGDRDDFEQGNYKFAGTCTDCYSSTAVVSLEPHETKTYEIPMIALGTGVQYAYPASFFWQGPGFNSFMANYFHGVEVYSLPGTPADQQISQAGGIPIDISYNEIPLLKPWETFSPIATITNKTDVDFSGILQFNTDPNNQQGGDGRHALQTKCGSQFCSRRAFNVQIPPHGVLELPLGEWSATGCGPQGTFPISMLTEETFTWVNILNGFDVLVDCTQYLPVGINQSQLLQLQ